MFNRHIYSEADVRRLMIQLMRGVAYLHSRGICHRDLKVSVLSSLLPPDSRALSHAWLNKLHNCTISTSCHGIHCLTARRIFFSRNSQKTSCWPRMPSPWWVDWYLIACHDHSAMLMFKPLFAEKKVDDEGMTLLISAFRWCSLILHSLFVLCVGGYIP